MSIANVAQKGVVFYPATAMTKETIMMSTVEIAPHRRLGAKVKGEVIEAAVLATIGIVGVMLVRYMNLKRQRRSRRKANIAIAKRNKDAGNEKDKRLKRKQATGTYRVMKS